MNSWLAIDFGDNPLKEGGNLYLNGEIVTSVVIPDGCTNAGAALGTCSSITCVEGGAEEVLNFALASVAPAYKLIITSGTLEKSSVLSSNKKTKFSDCAGLVEVEIRNGVTIEGASSKTYGVFANCAKLEKVTINTAEVGAYAFYQCTSLKYVVLGSNVMNVASNAFDECEVTCAYNFGSCHASANYVYNYNDGYLLSDDGYITTTVDSKIVLCHYIGLDANVVLSEDVNIIGNCAFASNTDIQSVAISTTAEKIEQNAFNGCSNLTAINYGGTIDEWNAMVKQDGWDNGLGEYTINCSDGAIPKSESAESATE